MKNKSKRAKMALDCSPESLRLPLPIFFSSLSDKNLQEFLDRSKFCKQFLKRVTQGTFL